jgi:hypothetical protein
MRSLFSFKRAPYSSVSGYHLPIASREIQPFGKKYPESEVLEPCNYPFSFNYSAFINHQTINLSLKYSFVNCVECSPSSFILSKDHLKLFLDYLEKYQTIEEEYLIISIRPVMNRSYLWPVHRAAQIDIKTSFFLRVLEAFILSRPMIGLDKPLFALKKNLFLNYGIA